MTIVSSTITMRTRRKYSKLSTLCKHCELDTVYMDTAIFSASLKAMFCDTKCYCKYKEIINQEKEGNYDNKS